MSLIYFTSSLQKIDIFVLSSGGYSSLKKWGPFRNYLASSHFHGEEKKKPFEQECADLILTTSFRAPGEGKLLSTH